MQCLGSAGPGLPAPHGSEIHPCRCCLSPALTICRRMPGSLATGCGSPSRSGEGSFASRFAGLWPQAGRRRNRLPDPREKSAHDAARPSSLPDRAGRPCSRRARHPADLDEQREGYGWHRYRTGTAVVHPRFRDRERGLLSAGDLPQIRDLGFIVAGPGVLVRGETKRGLHAPTAGCRHPRGGDPAPPSPLRWGCASRPTQTRRPLIECRLDPVGARAISGFSVAGTASRGDGRGQLARSSATASGALWRSGGGSAWRSPRGSSLSATPWPRQRRLCRDQRRLAGFRPNGAMTWPTTAGPGNVALMGELPRLMLALGFGSGTERPRPSRFRPDPALLECVAAAIADWEPGSPAMCTPLDDGLPQTIPRPRRSRDCAAVASRQDLPGAMVASLSIPWGNTADDFGGYHLVWPRDLVECAGALLALGAREEARTPALPHRDASGGRTLEAEPVARRSRTGRGSSSTKRPSRSCWRCSGRARRARRLEVTDTVRRALSFVARTGPASEQDRWEETRRERLYPRRGHRRAGRRGGLVANAGMRLGAGARRLLE